MRELKEKNTCSRQHRAGNHKPDAEYQRYAILRTLKSNQAYRREHECQQPGHDLQISLQHRVRLQVVCPAASTRQENAHESRACVSTLSALL